LLYVGDDWAEDHHDVELQDEDGRRLAKARLPEGIDGIGRLHALIGEHVGCDGRGEDALVGIETDRGPWVTALVSAGYRVYAINPKQVARFRERHANSGAKSDAGDAHALADMVRTDAHQLRPIAGDSVLVEGIKVLARAHQGLIWDRTRHVLRLRAALLEYFPAALEAFDDLSRTDTLELLAKAPEPALAAKLTQTQIGAALARARRRAPQEKAGLIQTALRTKHLMQPPMLTAAYAETARSLIVVISVLNAEITRLQEKMAAQFTSHPAAAIYTSQPGLAEVLGARVLAEFGDDRARYATAKARKNYAGTSPITKASGKKITVQARYVHNDRLINALHIQAMAALHASPGARAYYDRKRAAGLSHHAALRQLANRLVGILHGCLRHGSFYDETTAWPPAVKGVNPAAA